LGTLSPEQELAIDALTRGIVNKVMHTPIRALKTAAREQQATTVLDVFRRIFNLQDNLHDNNLEGNLRDNLQGSETLEDSQAASLSDEGSNNASPGGEQEFSLRDEISTSEHEASLSQRHQTQPSRLGAGAGKQGRS
jgi:hypothetical protein